jgi:hypothetical protein
MSGNMRVTLAALGVGLLVTGYVVWHEQTRNHHRPSKVTFSNKVDWGKLGLRGYPGARLLRGHTVEGEAHFSIMADLHTADDFDKVAEFFRGEYPSLRTIRESGGEGTPRVLELAIGSVPDAKSVIVREDTVNHVTVILLAHHTGGGQAPPSALAPPPARLTRKAGP